MAPLVAGLLALALPSNAAAQVASVALSAVPALPSEVTVGQRDVAGQLIIVNQSTAAGPVTLTQIGYDPACRTVFVPCGAPDLGVFVVDPTAIGTGGACAGVPFAAVTNETTGRVTFVPQGTAIVLAPPISLTSSCTIDFTFDVVRMPTDPTQPPPATSLTRAVAIAAGQSGAAGSTAVGSANITVRREAVVPSGRYVPLTPSRILDTRDNTGGVPGPVGPSSTVNVQVTGRGGVPASGVAAVAMNVAVTDPTGSGYLTLYPAGTARPLAANLNFTPGKTVPNLVVVKLGNGGSVDLFNSAGSTHVIYDVAGYFSDTLSGTDGHFQPLEPTRILDTRDGTGGSSVRLGPGASLDLQVTGRGGVPATGAEAVVMNVAVTNTTATSYLTVHPTGEPRPLAANLNWTAGDTVSNRVIAKLGNAGRVTLYNNAGDTDLVVDTNGWFTDANLASASGLFAPITPTRILDTRNNTGAFGFDPVPAGATIDVPVTGVAGVPATATAVILNATVVSPGGPGFLTFFPAGTGRPNVSDLNYAAGETRPNLVIGKLGTNGMVSLYTSTGTHVIFDVAGYFT